MNVKNMLSGKMSKRMFYSQNNYVQKMGIETLYICEIERRLVWPRCEDGGGKTQGRSSIILGNATFSKPS